MTKENTFNLLKRMPFKQIRDEWYKVLHGRVDSEVIAWLVKRGWTWKEFRNELLKKKS